MSVEWTMELNNALQGAGKAGSVIYDMTITGPANRGTWTVEAKQNGLIVGRGSATTKQAAKDLASEEAMKHLYPTRHAALSPK